MVTWLAVYGSFKHHSVIHSRGLSRRTCSIIKENMESTRTHESANKGAESIGKGRKQLIELLEVSCFLLLDLSLFFLLCFSSSSSSHQCNWFGRTESRDELPLRGLFGMDLGRRNNEAQVSFIPDFIPSHLHLSLKLNVLDTFHMAPLTSPQ